jgi:hypothetical protein
MRLAEPDGMKLRAAAVIATIAVGPSIASAQELAPADEKDEDTALGASLIPVIAGLAGTVITAKWTFDDDPPLAVKLTAWGSVGLLTFGPSFGHWYAGETVTTGLLLRGGGLAGLVGGVALLVNDVGDERVGIGLALAGQAAFATGIVHDLWTVRRSVRERAGERSTTVVPLVGETSGLALAGDF